jgi:hypothetical protein
MVSSEALFGAVGQIGFAVADLDRSIEAFSLANGGALQFAVFDTVLDTTGHYRYYGRPNRCELRIATARIGALDFEFIQVLSGHHPARDFVERAGDGINHLGIYIDDLDDWRGRLSPLGARVIIDGEFSIRGGKTGRFAYVQLAGGGPLYELLQL